MAEFAATIIGLASTAEVVFSRVYKYAKDAYHSERDIWELSAQISSLYGVLKSVSLVASDIERAGRSHILTNAQITSCASALDRLRDKLSHYHEHGDLETGRLLKKKKLKWPFTIPETVEMCRKLQDYKTTLALSVSADGLTSTLRLLETAESTKADLGYVKGRMEAQAQIELTKENEKVLDTLCRFRPTNHHKTNSKLRHKDTGSWFLSGQRLSRWMSQPNSKLWVYGIPGAGKTILASAAIDQALSISDADHAVAYFYCDYKVQETHEIKTILRSVAGQLARQDERSFSKAKAFVHEHCDHGDFQYFSCEDEELSSLIIDMAHDFEQVMILVDGLDECGDHVEDVVHFLASFSTYAPQIKTMCFSRNIPEIREQMQDFEHLSIAAENTDLRIFVGHEIEERSKQTARRRLRIKSTELKGNVMDTLINGAEGCFRWVVVQLDYIGGLASDFDIRQALKSLPTTLDSSYERLLDRINQLPQPTQEHVHMTLKWVIWEGPIQLGALCDVLSVKRDTKVLDVTARPDGDAVLRACGSLLRQNAGDERVESAHFTVKEFLCGLNAVKKPQYGAFQLDQQADRRLFAIYGGTYLACKNFERLVMSDEELGDREKEYPFRITAVRQWPSWMVESEMDEELLQVAKSLFKNQAPGQIKSWGQEFYYKAYYDGLAEFDEAFEFERWRFVTPLHYAALLNLAHICTDLLENDPACDVRSIIGSPIHAALIGFQVLPLHIEYHEKEGMYFHDVTFFQDPYNTVEVLIRHGADINGLWKCWELGDQASPLRMALWHIRQGSDLSNMLLKAGARVDRDCCRLLDSMLDNGDDETVDAAAEIISAIDMQNVEDSSKAEYIKLLSRSQESHPDGGALTTIAQQLQVGDVEESKELLFQSCLYDQVKIMIEMLERAQINVNVEDDMGRTPLHIACSGDSLAAAVELIKRGANIEHRDEDGVTPLHVALAKAGEPLIRILLENGADPLVLDDEEEHVWFKAIRNPDEVRTLHLLQSLAPAVQQMINKQRADQSTVLHDAVWYPEACRLLLEAGADEWLSDKRGRTLFHSAALAGAHDIVESLLSRGHDSTALDGEGKNVLVLLSKEETLLFPNTRTNRMFLHLCKRFPELLLHSSASGETALLELLRNDKQFPDQFWLDIEQALRLKPRLTMAQTFQSLLESKNILRKAHTQVFEIIAGVSAEEWLQADLSSFLSTLLFRSDFDQPLKEKAMCDLVRCMNPDSLRQFRTSGMQLHNWALTNGMSILVERILEKYVDVVTRDDNVSRLNAVQCALQYGCSDRTLGTMITAVPDLAVRGPEGETLLHYAVLGRSPERVKTLINLGLDINARCFRGFTPLALACATMSVAIASTLILFGADTSLKCHAGWAPCHFAAARGTTSILELLASQKSSWTEYVSAPIEYITLGCCRLPHLAAIGGHLEALQYLLGFPELFTLDEKAGEYSFLAIAVARRNVVLVRHLLDLGCKESAMSDGSTPLHSAVEMGEYNLVQALVQHAFNPYHERNDGHSPISIAKRYGFVEILRCLTEKPDSQPSAQKVPSTKVDQTLKDFRRRQRSLGLAIKDGDIERCKSLLRLGASAAGSYTDCGCNPLITALSFRQVDIAEYLLDHGAKTTGTACETSVLYGYNALHICATDDESQLMNRILDMNPGLLFIASPVHPLHLAALHQSLKCLSIMLERRTACWHAFRASGLQWAPSMDRIDAWDMISNLKSRNESPGIVHLDELVDIAMKYPEALSWHLGDDIKPKSLQRLGVTTPLHCASTCSVQTAKLLLSHGASFERADSVKFRTPLHIALTKGVQELADILLAKGASLDRYETHGVLHRDWLAAVIPENHRLPSGQSWHDRCHVDLSGTTALEYFITSAAVTSLEEHLVDSRDLFIPDLAGYMPVYEFWEAEPTMQTYALNSAIDLTLYDPAFGSVFQFAIRDGKLSFLRRLLKKLGPLHNRRLLNLKPTNRHTPLYYTCGAGQMKAAKLLISNGADLNLHGGLFGSALMAAATYGRFEVVKMLVWAGAAISYYSPELRKAVSAFDAAKLFPEIQRWMLVERWRERRALQSSS